VTTVLFTAGYFMLCMLTMPTQEAALTSIFAGLSLFGVTRLCRAQSPLLAFRWFRSYPLRGIFVLALTCSGLLLGIVNSMGLKLLFQLPLIFFWFWLFASIGTYFAESRISKSKN
jgi:hypothetical protein